MLPALNAKLDALRRELEEGRFSINPPDDSGPEDTSEYAELQDIQRDMAVIDAVLPQLRKLNPSTGGRKLIRAVEKFRDALEQDATEVQREFDKKYRDGR